MRSARPRGLNPPAVKIEKVIRVKGRFSKYEGMIAKEHNMGKHITYFCIYSQKRSL